MPNLGVLLNPSGSGSQNVYLYGVGIYITGNTLTILYKNDNTYELSNIDLIEAKNNQGYTNDQNWSITNADIRSGTTIILDDEDHTFHTYIENSSISGVIISHDPVVLGKNSALYGNITNYSSMDMTGTSKISGTIDNNGLVTVSMGASIVYSGVKNYGTLINTGNVYTSIVGGGYVKNGNYTSRHKIYTSEGYQFEYYPSFYSGTIQGNINLFKDNSFLYNAKEGVIRGSATISGAYSKLTNLGHIYGGVTLTGARSTLDLGGSFGPGNVVVTGNDSTLILHQDTQQDFVGFITGASGATLDLTTALNGSATPGYFSQFLDGPTKGFGHISVVQGSNWINNGYTFGAGVTLVDFGTFTNQGEIDTVVTLASAGVFTNNGSSGPVIASDGGTVINQALGVIRAGYYGVRITGAAGRIDNSGVLAGGTAEGARLNNGGYLINRAGALITGGYGVYIGAAGGLGTLVNDGVISGKRHGGYAGAYLFQGGTVLNSGTMYSDYGTGLVLGGSGSTVTNTGQIDGGNGVAVRFSGGNDRLIIGPSSGFIGTVEGDADSVLELSGQNGSLINFSEQFTNFDSIVVDSDALWTLAASQTIVAGVSIASDATLTNQADISSTVTLGSGGSLANSGIINGVTAVYLQNGTASYVANVAGGFIEGDPSSGAGIGSSDTGNVTDTIINFGTITGNTGIALTGPGASRVVDYGTIEGQGGTAIAFGDGNDTLVLGASAVIDGDVDAGGGTNTLELLAGSGGTVSGLGTTFQNFETIVVDQGPGWSFTDDSTVGNGVTLNNYGFIAGSLTVAQGGILNNGNFYEGRAVIDGGVANDLSVIFAGANGVEVTNGGLLNGGTIEVGTNANIYAGGVASDVIVENAGLEVNSGGMAANSQVVSYGHLDLASGGSAIGTTIASTGRGFFAAGATLSNLTAYAGAGVYGNGAVFTGDIALAAGAIVHGTLLGDADTTIELGSGRGDLSGISGAGAVTVDTGASWTLTGANTLGDGSAVTNNGTLTLDQSQLDNVGTLTNNGAIVLDPSDLTVGALVGTGSTTIDAGSTLTVGGEVGSGQAIVFDGAGGTLNLSDPATFAGTIDNFVDGDTIDLTSNAFTSGGSANLSPDGTVLNIDEDGQSFVFDLSGDDVGQYFHLASNGATGTFVTESEIPCYCRGTLILTDRGEVAVEDLRIGDRLMTVSGQARPIHWIGRRSYSGAVARDNVDLLPILIRAGALGEGLPRRHLSISPCHAMYLDGVLIPAGLLTNGATVVQQEQVDQVDYFHLELDSHDVIFAEGAPSETFGDEDNRRIFENYAEYRTLYPDEPQKPVVYYAPRVEHGPMLEAVRSRLSPHSPAPETETPALKGYLDLVSSDMIAGWAYDHADRPVRVRISDNDVVIGTAVADGYRSDLERIGNGTGKHCFRLTVIGGLSPLIRHVVRVQRMEDGVELAGSPVTLEARSVSAPALGGVAARQPAGEGPHGNVDVVTREAIEGWAVDPSLPDMPVPVQIMDNGVFLARALANRQRLDLVQAGFGYGRHGFEVSVPGGLSPLTRHVIQVLRETDGAELPGSPRVIEPASNFDPALEQTIANAIAALNPGKDQDRVVSFMLRQTDTLLQKRAEDDGRRKARLTHLRLRGRAGAIEAPGRRALVIDECVPVIGRDAGSQAIMSHMAALRRLGYTVSFVAAREMEVSSDALTAADVTICSSPFYTSVEDVLQRQTGCFDLIYLHRMDIAARYLALVRGYMPKATVLYSVADLHHVRMRRQAMVEGRADLLAASKQARLTECLAAWSADAVITHSDVEASLLRQMIPRALVHQVPWNVPVGDPARSFQQRHGVAFVGGYAHTPNVDAAHVLVETVMPLVWAVDPDIDCILAGSAMPASVRRLAGPRVLIAGQVGDLRAELFDRVKVTVAPLRYGAGVKGKVVDSLAAGVPCVMSEIGAEGLALHPGQHGLVGRTPADLAGLICRMHHDSGANAAAAAAGRSFIERHFSAHAVTDALRSAISDAAVSRRSLGPIPAMVGTGS